MQHVQPGRPRPDDDSVEIAVARRAGSRGLDLPLRHQHLPPARANPCNETTGEPVNVPAPLGAREPGPPAEGLAGGSDRCVDLVERRCAHAPDDLLGGAIPPRPNSPNTDLLDFGARLPSNLRRESNMMLPRNSSVCGKFMAVLARQVCQATAALSPRG